METMKIVIAPDSFKECLASQEVAVAMAEGVLQACPSADVIRSPLADGGEGTLDVLAGALQATVFQVDVSDPLDRAVKARLAVLNDIAIIEAAQACGLSLLAPEERNPLIASSKGVGELIVAAYRQGYRHFVVGLGGSATCDGGAGMLSVPGIKDILNKVSMEILCDVDNPFIGPEGAARVFAPQKGASPQDVEVLENRMAALARQMQEETGINVSSTPGAGAAGGLGGALIAYAKATLTSGVGKIMDLIDFDAAVRDADLIITGEGRSDLQTLKGKVPMGVLRRCEEKKVALLSGAIDDAARDDLIAAGFWRISAVTPKGMPLQDAMEPSVAKKNIRSSVQLLIT